MVKKIVSPIIILLSVMILSSCKDKIDRAHMKIDREALVKRHTVKVEKFDSLASLTVGNGSFAFTVDATGLQTFPGLYEKGISLGTQSEWGWHSFPDTSGFEYEEILKEYDFYGRQVTFNYQWQHPERKKTASDYLRQNPHRLHLGIVGLEIYDESGREISPEKITSIRQQLNMWKGEIKSFFKIGKYPVEVTTYCHQELDIISAQIKSELLKTSRIKIRLKFPYPTGKHVDSGCDWTKPQKHSSVFIKTGDNYATIQRTIDSTTYYVSLRTEKKAEIIQHAPHYFLINPDTNEDEFSFSCLFSPEDNNPDVAKFLAVETNSIDKWKEFWNTGGAIDFFGSKDPRAFELERRIILSQYLMKVQCAGNYPPQETGLTFNSWFGKFHLEMHWWHAVHYALWNRVELLEKSLGYYALIADEARKTAARQGFKGLRWPKMTDLTGIDSPSGIGPFLIWQQPHFIYFAELCYRHRQDSLTLKKYAGLVFETADFMASFAHYDELNDRYVLGPPMIPAQECFKPEVTFNPPYELAYWHWGLSTAQKWRERMGMSRNPEWDSIINKLSPLAISEGIYLLAESAPDSYTEKHNYDHPAVFGALGKLPLTPLVDTSVMHKTFNYIWDNWQWEKTWGWDFPLTAMTATRLGLPEKAIDALFMDIPKNTFLANGHNYQDQRLRIYLPGNGGLLTTVAMMCAGWDGCEIENPGIPKNDQWKVRWENLAKMP
ncbi:MAG: hypothetical protein JXB00_09545 [Bacteroidales bacterium]|nr:hypothetical protein [Bacteroidales bacterium]